MPKEKTPSTPKTTKPRVSKKKTVTAIMQPVQDTVVRSTPADLEAEIRQRAYELYLQRDGMVGDPHQDWLAAEQEVRSRYAAQS